MMDAHPVFFFNNTVIQNLFFGTFKYYFKRPYFQIFEIFCTTHKQGFSVEIEISVF